MSSSVGGKVVGLDDLFSVTRLNLKFITRMTGAEIAAHNIAGEPLNVLCIADGSGYVKGHFYVITDDGIIFDVFNQHTHTSTTDGGDLYSIYRANYNQLVEINQSLNFAANSFYFTKSGAGTWVDAVDTLSNQKYGIMTTATAANDYCNIEGGGGRLWFGKPATFQIKYAVSHNTSVAYRMGVGTPLIQNTVTGAGAVAQFGFEGCTGTNQLNRVFSADGTTWSGEDMLNMVQSVPMGLRIDWYPTSKIVATDGAGTSIFKITNLPLISTATTESSTFRSGIKALATSAARNLKIYALRLTGYSYDNQITPTKGWI